MGCYKDCISFCKTQQDQLERIACMNGCGTVCAGQGLFTDDEVVVEAEPVSNEAILPANALKSNAFIDAPGTCFKDCVEFCRSLGVPDQINSCLQGCGPVCYQIEA